MFSEKTKVLRARRGSPEKKSVSPRYHKVSNNPNKMEEYVHFRDTAEGRLQLLVRYRRGRVHTSHRGLDLLLSDVYGDK